MGFLFLVLYPLLPPPPAYPPNPPTHNIIKHHIQYITLKHSHVITHTHTSSLTHTHHTHTSLTHTHLTNNIIKASHRIHHSHPPSSITSNTSLPHTSFSHTSFSHTHHSLSHTSWKQHHQSITSNTSLTRPIKHHIQYITPSGVPSGVPWSPPLCRWLLRGRRGTWCTAKGSDVRPGVPLASLGLRRSAGGFCVAGAGLGALQRGRMYALASLWRPLVSVALPVAFVWQVRDLVDCKGSDVRPGVPLASLGLRRSAGGFCVAGEGLGALQRGRMYARPPLSWRPSGHKSLEKHSVSRLSYLFAHLDRLSSEAFSFVIFLLLFSSLLFSDSSHPCFNRRKFRSQTSDNMDR